MSHLLIIDGHAIAHRAYHSIPPLSTSGQPINAIYGFYSMLLSALEQLNPDYLLVCLDAPGPTFRDQEYIGYRAQRKPTESDLVSQLILLPDTLSTASIPNYALTGYEADDLIATISTRSQKRRSKKTKKNFIKRITIITGDKDLMQLVDDKVSLFVPIRGLSETKLYDPKAVKEKLLVRPDQVIDLKALMGDPSDNYPGVPGVGPKTASDLLEKYDSLDHIYQSLDELKPNLAQKLADNKDSAYLSQMLATIVHDAPLEFNLQKARWTKKRTRNLLNLFKNYNFRSLISRTQKIYPYLAPKPLLKKKAQKAVVDPNQSSLF